ncbi:hypothetical protein GL325_02555 [Aeromicrobium sp. 636]|uniref:Uncharacterized protein n=1 Tax=Aeromicrobium senzhongii TaxID=2663859 RepID=A0A8I0ERQ6_9ACTN|nr:MULTISPECIES: hypothetical protein [Aeromicrobium]MBC9225196.1 hypothetical protein [Aeromicrobium senzhongii]MCQ3997306.1 hypothetical protein [Aeromicrobium sp. 636]
MSDALQGLRELARVEVERDGLQQQLQAARQQVDEAARRYVDAAAKLEQEKSDVAELESFSMARILAGLRGTRDVDLSREQAEYLAAQYATSDAEARLAAARREVIDRETRLDAIGDLEARRVELLNQRERELAADPGSLAVSTELTELAARQGVLEAEVVQLQEAITAASQASEALREASLHLGNAGSWATYDTFFGGGLVADLAKHNRLDKAGELMHRADAALAHLSAELADVRVDAVGSVGVTELARTFDIWFDNIFSDLQVRGRIHDAAARVDGLLRDVESVGRDLTRRLADAERSVSAVEDARRDLLVT